MPREVRHELRRIARKAGSTGKKILVWMEQFNRKYQHESHRRKEPTNLQIVIDFTGILARKFANLASAFDAIVKFIRPVRAMGVVA